MKIRSMRSSRFVESDACTYQGAPLGKVLWGATHEQSEGSLLVAALAMDRQVLTPGKSRVGTIVSDYPHLERILRSLHVQIEPHEVVARW